MPTKTPTNSSFSEISKSEMLILHVEQYCHSKLKYDISYDFYLILSVKKGDGPGYEQKSLEASFQVLSTENISMYIILYMAMILNLCRRRGVGIKTNIAKKLGKGNRSYRYLALTDDEVGDLYHTK